MYEQFWNEDNDKSAADAQAALRLSLEAIGSPPAVSRTEKEPFSLSKEDLVNALANAFLKSYSKQEKKAGESTLDNLLTDSAAAVALLGTLTLTGKNGPLQKATSEENSAITIRLLKRLAEDQLLKTPFPSSVKRR